jgi:hypothetical protein
MTTYGYRIHTLQPHVRRTQEWLQLDDVSAAGGDSDPLEQVYTELTALLNVTKLGTPTFIVDSQHEELRLQEIEDADDVPYFTVLKVHRDGRVLEVIVETGKEADHDGLRSRDGTQEPIKRKAAVRTSSVILLFPSKGDFAIMVSEVRGRTSAGELLMQWVTRTAQRGAFTETEKGKREDLWLNWKPLPRIDGQRLDGILNGSSEHAFRLRRKTLTAQGMRGGYDLELVQFGLKRTPVEKVLDVLMKMSARRQQGTEQERRAAAAADVLTLVEPNVGGVEFTDGELSFNENGKKQTITSETIDQLFIYPLGSKRPKVAELREKAAPVVQRIAPTLGIQVNLAAVNNE